MKESKITITDYTLLVKNVQVYDVLTTIRKLGKKIWKKPNYIEKTTKINLNKKENQIFHKQKIYRILKIKLTP